MKTAIIVLAAGSSERLGRPKQLLTFNGKTLIEHAVSTAKATPAELIILVTGASKILLNDEAVAIVHNEQWQEGMASSIRAGVYYLTQHAPSIEDVILMVCDQPYVSSILLDEIISVKESTKKNIVASVYQGVIGTPVLFNRSYFPSLALLAGDKGAKEIILNNPSDLATVNFEKGIIDIDTEEDYLKLQNS